MLLDLVIAAADTQSQAGAQAFFGFFGVTSALVFASELYHILISFRFRISLWYCEKWNWNL